MGEHYASKMELHDLARTVAAEIVETSNRSQSLALCFDVLVTVLGVEEKVKAELEKRRAEARAKAEDEKPRIVAPAALVDVP